MKPVTAITVLFLALLSLLQLGRVVLGWEVIVNGVAIPLWASGVACLVAAALALLLWRQSRR
ncbi:MAG: hypothetical protein LC715_07170 [Gammaproteobacteria bacterium]|nr:hypothetical protein [Gammaproteobacteria bacterium]